ncbi:phage portal protein [Rhizobium sp. DKSPLA3]|uniref:Phage portal protein n=2 Tax=Rhizobium quercicola TaxID=2901226 RepID=A0A9X1NSW5_9HYPH|nr:phage portal protein [Rhizobium quercicola]
MASAGETRSLAEPTIFDFEIFGASASLAGVSVTPATAARVPAVAAGVRALSEAVGILPLHAFRRTETGRERDNTLPAFRLLNGDANPWTRGAQLRELLTSDAIYYGSGYALILRDSAGAPVELHRIHPTAVSVEIDARTSEPRYRLTEGGGQRYIPYADILHLRAPSSISTDSVTGRSPLLEAKNAVGLLITLQEHACRLFANGGRPSGILSFPQKLGAEVAKRIKASWQAATGGGNTSSTAVIEEGGSFIPLSFTSVDAQFMEIWALAITEVARLLRVPPVLLMDYSRQTWANAETGGQQFLTYSLAPWLARWEAEVTLKLIAPEDRENVFVEHLPDQLLRSDFATRATAYGQYRSMGVMTANEVRSGLNLPPLATGNELSNPYTSTTKPEPTALEETKTDE